MITPTKPDEHGVRWCQCSDHPVHTECEQLDHENGWCEIARCSVFGICLPWIRAVMKANQLWLDAHITNNDLRRYLGPLQTLDDIGPIYRELFPEGSGKGD